MNGRDARRLSTGKNYAPKRTRLESVAGFNTAHCDAEPPPRVKVSLITLNTAPAKFDAAVQRRSPRGSSTAALSLQRALLPAHHS